MPEGQRTGLTLVCGTDRVATAAVAVSLRPPRGVLVAHDLRGLGEGVVHRRVVEDGGEHEAILTPVSGDPDGPLGRDLLADLARDPRVAHLVLLLDPGAEPATVLAALHAHLAGAIEVRGVVGVLDAATWLDDASGDATLAEHGRALSVDDDRTVARLAVEQTELADVLVVTGRCPTPWDRVRLEAVLDRLAPRAARLTVADVLGGAPELAREVGDEVRTWLADPTRGPRTPPDGPHAPLLRGEPPLTRDAGVSLLHVGHRRPFHPERLHAAADVLLHGTVRARGRVWVASQPDRVLWLESAGGALEVRGAGRWLAADPAGWDDAGDERRAAAALRWDDRFGDREQQLVVLVHDADPADIVEALDAALLTDAELARGEDAWRRFADPFADRHVDPCDALDDDARRVADRRDGTTA
jgi:G3E family GTPase